MFSHEQQIQDLIQAIQSKVIPHVAQRVNSLSPDARSEILTPALNYLAERDPASAQWFVRYGLSPTSREQLKQGIHQATIEFMTQSGFIEGRDFHRQAGELILSRAVLPYTAADDDPWGQLLVAEFCQLLE